MAFETERLIGRRILVTGAAGFIGTAILGQLASLRCAIRCVRHRAAATVRTPLVDGATLDEVAGDVSDPGFWREAMDGIDTVLHLAAQTSVYTANADPRADLAANVEPIIHLAQECRRRGTVPAVIAAGTATVVGLTTTAEPVDERAVERPITFYDTHKFMAEGYLEVCTKLGFLKGTTLRLTNVYGPGPRGTGRERGFLNLMVRRALAGEALTLFGDGTPIRDYVYVDDVARAFLAAAANTETVQGEHFLIGSGQGTTLADALRLVVERVASRTGRMAQIASVEPPPGLSPIEARSFVAQTRRFRLATGWMPRVGLGEGIDRTIDALGA